ncbi:DUF3237 domain-containing protein [Sphingopyxis sp.]|uniref:DUF3237 domain-containing protein n=1 Tax=Sphingopyxis sp. TaxID=1908224 RepID=UPI003BA8CCEB
MTTKGQAPIELAHLFTLRAELAAGLDAGDGPLGRRTLNAVQQGWFEGDRLKGTVNPGTGDWMLTRNDIRVVDARLVLQTDDGALIHMSYGGRIVFPQEVLGEMRDPKRRHLVDPSRYYFRTNPVFETGSPAYCWLNRIVSIARGELVEGGVKYEVYELL